MKALLFWLALLTSESAMAYVDPGSGMLLIQGLIALIAGVIAFMKNPLKAVRDWIREKRKDTDA